MMRSLRYARFKRLTALSSRVRLESRCPRLSRPRDRSLVAGRSIIRPSMTAKIDISQL